MRRTGGALARSLAVGAAAVALLASSLGGATASAKSSGTGVVTFAELPSTPPNYIFPIEPAQFEGNQNTFQFSNLLYLPLYWFGSKGEPVLNRGLSVAKPPVFSSDDTVLSITLKHWRWSNGTPITARDVIFGINLIRAITDPNAPAIGSSNSPGPGDGDFTQGGFPENVVSYSATGTYTLTMKLNRAYNPTWFLYNELSWVYPLPQASWDRLSASGPIGNYDNSAETTEEVPASNPAWYVPVNPGDASSGPLGVAQFLNLQSENISTYATNPLWKVVDGPFRLSAFTTDGFVKMVPNPLYSGSPKPRISAFEEEPFTSDTAEYDALRSGSLTVGYLPAEDLSQKTSLEKGDGYKFAPWYSFGIDYMPYNFTDPTVGPIFKQLYFRKAFQDLVNQPEYVRDFNGGIASIGNGPAPTYPAGNPDESPLESRSQLFPYNPTQAVSLLKQHGWTVVPHGTSYCARPGAGAGECGAGIELNQKLDFNLLYATGSTEATNEMQALSSTLKAKAGITIDLSQASFDDVLGIVFEGCTDSSPCSNWEIGNWLGGWTYAPGFFPTGEENFASGAGSNVGDFSSATNDANIEATKTATNAISERSALFKYQDYLAEQLPVAWIPHAPLQLTMYKSNLQGLVPQNLYDIIEPQDYRLTK
jgi:peptide/nickel transport system substrate-binding protein